jgi:hypothetical protein
MVGNARIELFLQFYRRTIWVLIAETGICLINVMGILINEP